MHRWVVVASALVAAACVSIPEFDPDLAVHWDPNVAVVRGSNFVLQFGDGTFRFPTSLGVDGSTFLLGHSSEQALNCNTEDQAGVALYPAPRISPTTSATGDSSLDPAMYGPAVAKANLRWMSSFSCTDSVTRSQTGFSSFTIFPDGRIVRYDALGDTTPGQAIANPTACTCGSGENEWHVTTFWSLYRAPFDQLRTSDGPFSIPNGASSAGPICLEGSTASLTYANRLRIPPMPETRTNLPASDTVALVQDIVGGLTLGPLQQPVGANTVLQLGKTCSIPDAAAWQMTGGLADRGVGIPFANDGIYGGDNDGNGGGYTVNDGPVVLTGSVMTSFAVWLAFQTPAASLRVTRDNHQPGTWYIPQPLSDEKTNWVIWFRDGFVNTSETITIEPQAP